MKGFLKPKLIFTLVTVMLLASACNGPRMPGSITRPHAVGSVNSTQYPQICSGAFANAPLAGIQNGANQGVSQGHIGVDMWMNQSDLNNGKDYSPCLNPQGEPDIGACALPGGYYKVLHYCSPKSNDFPFGVFIDNNNNGVQSNWGNKISGVALEIYPYSDNVNASWNSFCNLKGGYDLQPCCGQTIYGGLRLVANNFNNNANGGSFSANIGLVTVPQNGDPGVGIVNGFICHSGANRPPSCPNRNNAPDHTVNFTWFGQVPVYNRSSTGYPVYSFNSWPNQSTSTGSPSSGSGYYTSGPLLFGMTKTYITNMQTGQNWLCSFNIDSYGSRVDFNLDDASLGHPDICHGN